jgi:F-type H+-transporting ATPase subunit epsilon
MKTFMLHLHDAVRTERIDGVVSFVGHDASGSFGILAGHARLVTVLDFGLARFRRTDTPWEYLALPEAVLYFADNDLMICTRRFLRDDDYERITRDLDERLRVEETELRGIKDSVHRLQEELIRRLWQMGRRGGEV